MHKENIMSSMIPYGSHSLLLTVAALNSGGPILELGAGAFSTPVLHGICACMGRTLVTLDSDRSWLNHFETLKTDSHRISYTRDFINLPEYKHPWGMVFIDHGVAEQRGHSLEMLRDVPIIICHDTNPQYSFLYRYKPIMDMFKYRFDHMLYMVQTTALSRTVDVKEIFGDKV